MDKVQKKESSNKSTTSWIGTQTIAIPVIHGGPKVFYRFYSSLKSYKFAGKI
jgi:hypothetical protein